MAAPDPRIVHGNLPDTDELIDEPNMLVQSLTRAATRELKEFKGGNKAIKALELTAPKLTFTFDAYISERAGLTTTHPGEAVPDLLNFTETYRGFDPTEGILLFMDPSDEQSVDNPETTKFTVTHYPHVVDA